MPQPARQQFSYTPVDNEVLRARALEQARLNEELRNAKDDERSEEDGTTDEDEEFDDERDAADYLEDIPEEEQADALSRRESMKKNIKEQLESLRKKQSAIDAALDVNDGILAFGGGCASIPVIGFVIGAFPLALGNVVKYITLWRYERLSKEEDKILELAKKYRIKGLSIHLVRGVRAKILLGYLRGKRWLFIGLGITFGVGAVFIFFMAIIFGILAVFA